MIHALLLALVGNVATYEQDGIRIDVEVEAQVYTWTITNVDAPPIMSFEIDRGTTYPPLLPDGWQFEETFRHLRAWSENGATAIDRRDSAEITYRTTSVGSVLGLSPVTIGFGPEQPAVVFPGVWAPLPRGRDVPILMLVTLTAVGLVHAGVARRSSRRGS
jgi:hypothetical protein